MTTEQKETNAALILNGYSHDGGQWWVSPSKDVHVSTEDNDDERIVFADADGFPFASVANTEPDLEYLIRRASDMEGLNWLRKWGATAGYDVIALNGEVAQ